MCDELLPCPFCGCDIPYPEKHQSCIVCPECKAFGPGHSDMTQEEMAEAWNTRAERTCTVVEKVNECSGLVNRCCSECGYVFGVKGFGRWEQPNYCTKCGAEVMH